VDGAVPPEVFAVSVTRVVTGSGVWVTGGSTGLVVIEAEKLPCIVTVKLPEDVPIPVGVVTEIAPEVAPEGTVADNWVELATENTVAEVPLNFTEVAPGKFVPLTVT
jgi:hypothetical protein